MNIQFRQNWIPENLKDNKKRHKEPKQSKEPKQKRLKNLNQNQNHQKN